MTNLILVRHGQSLWNAENKFTGWVDAGLSNQGENEARFAGKLISKLKIKLNHSYSSYLQRAIKTLDLINDELLDNNIKTTKVWQLNERHYGSLTGLNKKKIKKSIGEELFIKYRRSWDIAPPKIDLNMFDMSIFGYLYKKVPKKMIPLTESLKDTYKRVIPYYLKEIYPKINNNKNIIISAHGNSIRALCKYILNISDKKINELEIPTGNPMHFIFSDKKIVKVYYLDKARANKIFTNV